jgi:hypothetical protein
LKKYQVLEASQNRMKVQHSRNFSPFSEIKKYQEIKFVEQTV